MLALELFPEEYSVKSKSLGTQCKLFCQRQWNSSSWKEVLDTGTFIILLKDQIAVEARVTAGVLSIWLAFGRAKQGQFFEDKALFGEYTEISTG